MGNQVALAGHDGFGVSTIPCAIAHPSPPTATGTAQSQSPHPAARLASIDRMPPHREVIRSINESRTAPKDGESRPGFSAPPAYWGEALHQSYHPEDTTHPEVPSRCSRPWASDVAAIARSLDLEIVAGERTLESPCPGHGSIPRHLVHRPLALH